MNLLGASSFLSGLGIVVSIIGTISSISFFVKGILLWHARVGSEIGLLGPPPAYYTIGAVLLLMIPYLAMWILLKIKTSKKDIPGIEKIGKVYSYVSGSLEILAMISLIIFCAVIQYIYLPFVLSKVSSYSSDDPYYRPSPPPPTDDDDFPKFPNFIVPMIVAVIYLVFPCLKIHGIRVENNKLVGIYLGFQYFLFALFTIGFIITSVHNQFFNEAWGFFIIGWIVGGVYFILDIGLTVILHSIRVDRENTARTENPMKNF